MIEVNVVIDLPSSEDVDMIIQRVQSALSQINGEESRINVVEMDNPISGSPINTAKEFNE